MTVQANDGPLVTIGGERAMGSATAVTGITGASAGYISGTGENPDRGPNCFYAGNMVKDPYYRYLRGGGSLTVGGYPNQALGYVDHQIQTIDLVPSLIATANIAALQAPTAATALTLVSVTGAGITVLSAAFNVLNTGLSVPSGALRIDANPAWYSFGDSGAMEGWTGAACGRAVSLTSGANLSAVTFVVRGYDLYGRPQTENITGPNNTTVNGVKGWKWIASVTPNTTSVSTVSVGTADIFEFPLRADKFAQVTIYWNGALITANTGFVAAVTTDPATATTGSPRGTYAVQSASDGTKSLQILQRLPAANLGTLTGMWGVSPFA